MIKSGFAAHKIHKSVSLQGKDTLLFSELSTFYRLAFAFVIYVYLYINIYDCICIFLCLVRREKHRNMQVPLLFFPYSHKC